MEEGSVAIETWRKTGYDSIDGYRVARDMRRPPSENAVQQIAYRLWRRTGNEDELANWFEARKILLAQLVWQNEYLRTKILLAIPQRALILTFMHLNDAHAEEICQLISFYCKQSWEQNTKGKLGDVQIVIHETRGEVVMTPKAGFHPTSVFEMFE